MPYSAIPQRAASKRASGSANAAALFAMWRVRCEYGSVASRKRSICCRAKSGSVSAVARWLISPTTFAGGSGSSASPQRPMPVSSFRWTGGPSGISPLTETTSSSLASRASAISSAGHITMIRASGSSRRSSTASATVTTQSADAPASRAALATSVAPWP